MRFHKRSPFLLSFAIGLLAILFSTPRSSGVILVAGLSETLIPPLGGPDPNIGWAPTPPPYYYPFQLHHAFPGVSSAGVSLSTTGHAEFFGTFPNETFIGYSSSTVSAGRSFAAPLGEGTFWASVQLSAPAAQNGFMRFSMAGMTFVKAGNQWNFMGQNTGILTGTFVMRMDLAPGLNADTVELFSYANSTLTPLLTVENTDIGVGGVGAENSLQGPTQYVGQTVPLTGMSFQRIRVGTEMQDVIPVPEPVSMLVLLSGTTVLAFSRRRFARGA